MATTAMPDFDWFQWHRPPIFLPSTPTPWLSTASTSTTGITFSYSKQPWLSCCFSWSAPNPLSNPHLVEWYSRFMTLTLVCFWFHSKNIEIQYLVKVGYDFEEYGMFSDCIIWALSYTLSGYMWGDDLGKINKAGRYLTPLYGKIIWLESAGVISTVFGWLGNTSFQLGKHYHKYFRCAFFFYFFRAIILFTNAIGDERFNCRGYNWNAPKWAQPISQLVADKTTLVCCQVHEER